MPTSAAGNCNENTSRTSTVSSPQAPPARIGPRPASLRHDLPGGLPQAREETAPGARRARHGPDRGPRQPRPGCRSRPPPDHARPDPVRGLRVGDACKLPGPLDCIVADCDGQPYLRYYNHKINREALVPVDDQLVTEIGRGSGSERRPLARPNPGPVPPPHEEHRRHHPAQRRRLPRRAPPLAGNPATSAARTTPHQAHPAPVPPLARNNPHQP